MLDLDGGRIVPRDDYLAPPFPILQDRQREGPHGGRLAHHDSSESTRQRLGSAKDLTEILTVAW